MLVWLLSLRTKEEDPWKPWFIYSTEEEVKSASLAYKPSKVKIEQVRWMHEDPRTEEPKKEEKGIYVIAFTEKTHYSAINIELFNTAEKGVEEVEKRQKEGTFIRISKLFPQ